MIKHAEKTLRPMAEIISHQHLEGVSVALTTLLQRHRQCAVDGVTDAFRIIWIDQKRRRAFVRSAGETRKDQHARIFRVLCGHEFLRDKVHAVTQRDRKSTRLNSSHLGISY